MSAVRLLPLLLVAVLAVVLPVSVAGVDPTSACYQTQPAPATNNTGSWLSDTGYYQLQGLSSYYSMSYQVICAWRGLYMFGPHGQTNVYGPWHGITTDLTDCQPLIETTFNKANDWAVPGSGLINFRTNSLDGTKLITMFRLAGTCSTNLICAGSCGSAPEYEENMTILSNDPTYTEYTLDSLSLSALTQPKSSSAAASRLARLAPTQVITTLNSTQTSTLVIRSPSYPTYADKAVPALTGIMICYGYQTFACSSQA